MTDAAPRPARAGEAQASPARRVLVALAVLVVATLGLGSPSSSAPGARTATTGCVSVGGGAASGGGPQRATVVVDTGSGSVWSACISFSGSISGIKALELASATIPGLNPVYDTYAGQGKAVCRLLGVGTDPPDCLGKDVKYWNYFANGVYARGGAGNTTVNDGDVQGWRFGTGAAPRAATAGTAATSAPPPTTAPPAPPPTTAPAAPGSAPGSGGGISGSSGGTQSADPQGSANAPGPVDPNASDTDGESSPGEGGGTQGDDEATSTTAGEAGDEPAQVESASAEREGSGGSGGDSDEVAAGAASTDGASPVDQAGGSSWPAAFGFLAALAAIGAAIAVVRHRRSTVA